ncbi:hypothetical protein GCM10010123_08330 [Pilimelia anulata]|uniref:Uncharacterized protein n=1 Tax=Pilimelia anulata TaxID=53371 RepID=A0A8J3F7Q5_9ACTN|nr:hypothetical protein GCM10010123_08330 [Pilimelia anulata]
MKLLTTTLLTGMVAAAALLGVTSAPAGAADRGRTACVSVQPEYGFYEAGRVGSKVLTTPRSRCKTISVSHIKDPAEPSDRCQTFLLGFYPAVNGSLTYTDPVTACGDRETVLARNVPDRKKYIVIYAIDYWQQRIRFSVHH